MVKATLEATLVSRRGDVALVRLAGRSSGSDEWIGQNTTRPIRYFAEASVLGYGSVDLKRGKILRLDLVTLDDAAYWGTDGTSLPFASVLSMR